MKMFEIINNTVFRFMEKHIEKHIEKILGDETNKLSQAIFELTVKKLNEQFDVVKIKKDLEKRTNKKLISVKDEIKATIYSIDNQIDIIDQRAVDCSELLSYEIHRYLDNHIFPLKNKTNEYEEKIYQLKDEICNLKIIIEDQTIKTLNQQNEIKNLKTSSNNLIEKGEKNNEKIDDIKIKLKNKNKKRKKENETSRNLNEEIYSKITIFEQTNNEHELKLKRIM